MAFDINSLLAGAGGFGQSLLATAGPQPYPMSPLATIGGGLLGAQGAIQERQANLAAQELADLERQLIEQQVAAGNRADQAAQDRLALGRNLVGQAQQGTPGASATVPSGASFLRDQQMMTQDPRYWAGKAMLAGLDPDAFSHLMLEPQDFSASDWAVFENPSLGTKKTINIATPQGAAEANALTAQGWNRTLTPAASVSINQGGETPYDLYRQEFAGDLAESDSEYYAAIRDAATKAEQTIYTLEQMDVGLSGDFETGSLSGVRVGLGRFANLLGVDLAGIGLGPGAMASADAINTASSTLTQEYLEGFKGNTSNRELAFSRESVPGLMKTPEGNALLVEMKRAISNRLLFKRTMADAFMAEHNGMRTKDGRTFDGQWKEFVEETPLYTEDQMERMRTLMGLAPSDEDVAEAWNQGASQGIPLRIYNPNTGEFE